MRVGHRDTHDPRGVSASYINTNLI